MEPAAVFKFLSTANALEKGKDAEPILADPQPPKAKTRSKAAAGSRAVADLETSVAESPATEQSSTQVEKINITVVLGNEHVSNTAVTWQPGRQSNGFFLILGAFWFWQDRNPESYRHPDCRNGHPGAGL